MSSDQEPMAWNSIVGPCMLLLNNRTAPFRGGEDLKDADAYQVLW
jgi:hypothetical protein